jgi:hypothetical protein
MPLLGFSDLSALRGLDARQRAMLDLRAIYEGTQYERVTIKGQDQPALPWDLDVTATGTRIPASHRKPMIQIGVPDDIVDRVVDLAIGEGRFPALEVDGDDEGRLRDVMLGGDDLELAFHAPDQLVDLTVVGSMAVGFSHPVDADTGFSRWEPVLLETEWCETVFAGGREQPRARELAAELSLVEGSGVETAEDGKPIFAMPEGARSDDLVFLRYQWPVAEERAATETGVGKEDVIVWYRRDYTTTAIVEYSPVIVESGVEHTPSFTPLPVEPHEWGVVPIQWAKSRGGRRGDTEGASMFSPALQSLTAAGDRSASFWTQAAHVSGSPTLVERDVTDDVRDALMLAMTTGDSAKASELIGAGPKSVLRYSTSGTDPDVSFLEISGAGPAALADNTDKLVDLAYETARVSRHDPDRMKGVLSGTALERLNEPTVALAQGYRNILGRAWRLLASKLAVAMEKEGEPGVSADAFDISLRWPRVFRLTATDVQQWAQGLALAIQAGTVRRETAIGIMASVLDIEDAEEEARAILAERGTMFGDGGGAPPQTPPAEPGADGDGEE